MDRALDEMYDSNCLNVAVYLINKGCGDEEEIAKVLAGSCYHGKLDMVKELVELYKVDPKGQHVYCFTISITLHSHYHLCCTDVRYEDGRSPLHWACEGGHKDVVEYLVEKANCDVSE